jgi:peptide/nickel transport system substrate-binding protein
MKKISMNKILIVSIAFALAFVLTLSSESAAAEKKILRYGAIPMKSTLDMELNTYNMVMDISDHIAEPLVRYDDDMKVVPVLIKELPKPSADGLVYRFELKPGTKFHDGTTLKAADVKYTFERMFTPSTGALMASLYTMIDGAQDMLDGKATSLKGFKIIDDNTFEFTLSYPYSPFIACLSTSYALIYPEKACKAAGKNWGLTTFIGTGPFKVTKLDLDNGVITERFADYHGAAPKLDGIEFLFIEDPTTRRLEYERGTIDVMFLDATMYPEYAKNPKLLPQIGEFTPMGTIFVNPNLNFEYMNNVKVREAISYAIDREALTRDLMRGTAKVATTFIPPGMMGYDAKAPKFEYNVEKAKKILAEAGYKDGFALEGYVRNTQINGTLGRTLMAIQSQLKAINIDLKITQVDPGTWTDVRNAGKVPLSIGNWYADFADPDGVIYSFLYSPFAKTLSNNYNKPEFDKLLEQARSISDPAKREELYKKAEHMATREDFAVLPLFNETMYWLAKPYVKNFKMTPAYVFHFFNTDIQKEGVP